MKYFITLSLALLITATSGVTAFAQALEAPIYASVKTTVSTTAAKAKNNTTAFQEIVSQLKDDVSYPHEQMSYRNELTVLVEVQVGKDGKISKSLVHNATSPELVTQIESSLKELKKVTPVMIDGQQKSRTLMIPLVFKK